MVVLRPSAARKATGWSLLGLGVLGCVLPFLQGFLFPLWPYLTNYNLALSERKASTYLS